ncbi:DUF370 domain-containing protein [Serpentinicella sp. ANB-PHB4]|uniref:extracellular matrix regulator RemB n=1 Tax=Serpentinicella sp. ANB-PHB4 TaxID=3074076 RepID=UPI002857DFE1|nr:extracellular matrix/biofilm biosynthesis regulator RemA family protein [Serpentinicella sp. ANB-PHB4]MDR5658916.1 DUF370 domain-containing protein [Serpentinicella sp. ANB-PHB4]
MINNNSNFLHIGGDMVVNMKNVIGIFDVKSALKSKHTKKFLKLNEKKGMTRKITKEETRSFILVEEKEQRTQKASEVIVYYSPIAALTLYKRVGSI